MNPSAMTPFGLAMLSYFQGDFSARLLIRRDDGLETLLPMRNFFREPAEFSPLEIAALERCRGHVLDIGAGSGLHALRLQSDGLAVTAIDVCSQAVQIMKERGVRDAHCADVFGFIGGPFETLLMLGHGIGVVEDLPGLDCFLTFAHKLTRDRGRLLIHSIDVRHTGDRTQLAYQEANRRAGLYLGQTRIQFEFAGASGPYCGWLHVDPETLKQRARVAAWACDIPITDDTGDFLAVLTKESAA